MRGERFEDGLTAPVFLFLTTLLVSGSILYTIRQCSSLLKTIRDRREVTTVASQADQLVAFTRQSHRSQHEDLQDELRSVQQLQAEVRTQLADLKRIAIAFQANLEETQRERKRNKEE